MVNAARVFRRCCAIFLLAALVLGAAAWSRSAEYDEEYTLFLTAGTPRPVWPETVFPADLVRRIQSDHASLGTIAHDLRQTDVHPPLYFWAVALWQRAVGSSLFAARLLSVGFTLAALAAVGVLARQSGVPPPLAMLLTLGCYGFVYTGSVARGFALAQMLSLWGVACLLSARGRCTHTLAAGALLGAATASNYLAVFVAIAAVVFTSPLGRGRSASALRVREVPQAQTTEREPTSRRLKGQAPSLFAVAGALPFLTLDLWFFLAQRGTRAGQFRPFHVLGSLARLARYSAADLFGGLPLYAPAAARPAVSLALAVLLTGLTGLVISRWRRIGHPHTRRILAAAALAPPLGLLALGLVFNNTPIELRYLSFAAPFIALLLAGALAALPRAIPLLLLTVQAVAIAGLMLRPETMQPARATAIAAAALIEGGIALLPHGNDGVGIVGAFALESPPNLPLLVIGADEPTWRIRQRIAAASRVVLVRQAQDASSRATVPRMQAALTTPCWRAVAEGYNVTAYERICAGE
jgi:Dolichyl-phosphate-mannose-protein mannosyltransferase